MGFAAAMAVVSASLVHDPYVTLYLKPFVVDPWPLSWLGGPPLDMVLTYQILDAFPALALYAGGVFWTLGYDTIYALQDIEDDAMVGVKSSARRLGSNVRRGVGVFYLLAVAFAALAGLLAGLGPLFYLGLTAYAAHLLMQTRSIRPDDAPHALALFKSNREAGLVLLLAIILGSVQLPL
jgi:4-hydroxybenzoate polyprenyltransferase